MGNSSGGTTGSPRRTANRSGGKNPESALNLGYGEERRNCGSCDLVETLSVLLSYPWVCQQVRHRFTISRGLTVHCRESGK